MNININNKGGRRFAPWTASLVLALFAAVIFLIPSTLLAQTYELSQQCATALVGTEHIITATVTDGDNPLSGKSVAFQITSGPNFGPFVWLTTGDDGTAEFKYTGEGGVGEDRISLLDSMFMIKANSTTSWTDDDQDPVLLACLGSPTEPVQSTQTVHVGGRGKLNVNKWKWGAMSIMVCSDGELDLHTVVPESVTLAGVAPVKWMYKDMELCPGGQDGYVDLTFMFKDRDMVKALEESVGEELADGDEVELELSGSLDDGTPIEGTYVLEIINKNKHRKHNIHKTFKCKNKVKKNVNKKGFRR